MIRAAVLALIGVSCWLAGRSSESPSNYSIVGTIFFVGALIIGELNEVQLLLRKLVEPKPMTRESVKELANSPDILAERDKRLERTKKS